MKDVTAVKHYFLIYSLRACLNPNCMPSNQISGTLTGTLKKTTTFRSKYGPFLNSHTIQIG